MPIRKSKRFVLRPYRKSDIDSLVKIMNDKHFSRFMATIPYPYKRKDAKDWIKKCINSAKKKNKFRVCFALDIDGKVVGGLSLDAIDRHKAEIGYSIGKDFWSKGIMTEAVKLVTNFGFKKLKLKRIYAYVFSKNKASIKVLEKNAYKREGLLKKYYMKNGKLYDTYIYAKTK